MAKLLVVSGGLDDCFDADKVCKRLGILTDHPFCLEDKTFIYLDYQWPKDLTIASKYFRDVLFDLIECDDKANTIRTIMLNGKEQDEAQHPLHEQQANFIWRQHNCSIAEHLAFEEYIIM